jgi:hypothetical protein
MNESRIRRYDRRRIPREKRTLRIWGAVAYIDGQPVKDQSNNLYHCWNCGFVCNTDRDQIGDGVGYTVIDQPDLPDVLNLGASANEFPQSNGQQDNTISVELINTPHLLGLGSDGTPLEIIHNNTSLITSGCPFCGCKQYK